MIGPLNSNVFGLLKGRLDVLQGRQSLIAENVANVTTPGYTPRDVDLKGFERAMASGRGAPQRLELIRSDNAHFASAGRAVPTRIMDAPDSEGTLDGNRVILEDQMLKLSETRMQFETAVGLYQKALAMVRVAAKGPR